MQDVIPGLPPQPVLSLVDSRRSGFSPGTGLLSGGDCGAARPAARWGQPRAGAEPVWAYTRIPASPGVPVRAMMVLTVDDARQPA